MSGAQKDEPKYRGQQVFDMGLEGVKNISRPLLKGGTEDKPAGGRGVNFSFINSSSLSKETTLSPADLNFLKN